MSNSELEQTRKTHQYFKDWISLNRQYIGDKTVDDIVVYQAFLAGWLAGQVAYRDSQMEDLRT